MTYKELRDMIHMGNFTTEQNIRYPFEVLTFSEMLPGLKERPQDIAPYIIIRIRKFMRRLIRGAA